MEKQIEVMKQSVELSGTIVEGLEHIQKLIGEGKVQRTIYMFEDVLLAYSTIEKSIEPINSKLESEQLGLATTNLKQTLELVVESYEEKDYGKVQGILQFTLIPQVKKWREELTSAFKPYIVS
ncbi:hypothetical protein [Halalkalibacter alkaliphilus]|uniref:DUF8042 domain-containing protein n=1 Tax=Halalkalibacter alkaliphilus TaxID=2917993 RepID=A0A9X1ZW95_9BACI|nr:hypothetical protein [Halalkalibacter alkaliphilus]MCL7746704.1 hypothetical protein [Halalkalibacter alkaliphilus]